MTKRNKFPYLLGLFGIAVLPAFNQVIPTDTAHVSLDQVTITALRIPVDARQFTRIARVISRKEIEQSTARDLAELLEYIPDIDVRQKGPAGVQSDISLRGGTFDQFAILINGINYSDPQTGHFQMDIPIPLSMIQRVEVLAGSDVKSLGSNAFTGAINIVTTIPFGQSIHAGLSYGRFGFLDAGIDAKNRSAKWWQQAGILVQKSDGYRENTDFRNLNGFFQAGYSHKHLDLSVMAGGLKKAFGANSFYTAKYPNQFERTGTGFTALQVEYKGKLNVRESIYYRLHSDEFSLFRTDPPVWYVSPNYHLSQTTGSKTDAWFNSALGKTGFGFEFRHESIWSTVLGTLSDSTKPVAGIESVEYNHFGSRTHVSLSAEQQVVIGQLKLNAGLVLHQVYTVKNYSQAYPGLDVSYSFTRALRTYLSLNRAFRLPTFTELYYKSPTNQGNSGLLPETAWHAEAGAEFRLEGLSAKLMGFYRNASQSIDWVRSETETIWHAENLGRIRTWGMETGISVTPVINTTLRKVIDRFDLGYRYYFQHHSVEDYYSQYVLDYLKWKMTTGLTIKAGSSFRISGFMVWQERNGSYTAFDSNLNMIEIDYKPFITIDVKLSYKFKWVTVIAGCTNILNQEYFDIGSVPQPGAWYRAGIEINLVGSGH